MSGNKGHDWVNFLLGVLLLMWMRLFGEFSQFHFLKVTKEIKSLMVTSFITCLHVWLVSWVNRGGAGVTFLNGDLKYIYIYSSYYTKTSHVYKTHVL